MKKAVMCATCRHKYHQELKAFESINDIVVHHCPKCGNGGRMIMGAGQPEVMGHRSDSFTFPKFPPPQLSLPVNTSYLDASPADLFLLHARALSAGFTCVGFHGCGSNAAESILKAVQDVSVTNARGRGFMVGSLRTGIPAHWSQQAKGGGRATILKVYVRNWPNKQINEDYRWGKMDPDDIIETEGLEMVLRPSIFQDVVALPSLDVDQALIHPSVWQACPTHSFSPEEIPLMQQLANHFNISLLQLEEKIVTEPAPVEAAAKRLGLNVRP